MLVVSTRRDNSVFCHGPTTWHLTDIGAPELEVESVHEVLAGRRVCVFIHGYNVDDALGAYAELAYQLNGSYDLFVGATWPGSKLKVGFWTARWRAEESGKRLAEALSFIPPELLDIQAHSLGCRVALEALKAGLHCRNLILAAAAVGEEDLSVAYADAVNRAQRVVVAHSHEDDVLHGAYRMALWHDALGLNGPRASDDLPPHVETWDLAVSVKKHSDYKRSGLYYQKWKEIA